MAVSEDDPREELAARARTVIVSMLALFDQASDEAQDAVPKYLRRLLPTLDAGGEQLDTVISSNLEELLAAREWTASEDARDRQIRLYRVGSELGARPEIREAIEQALVNDLTRVPIEGWSAETVGRARAVGEVAPPKAVRRLLEELPAIDWDQPALAAALARAQGELTPLAEEGYENTVSTEDVKAAYRRQNLPDAARAVSAWFASGPPAGDVTPILFSFALNNSGIAKSLRDWAAKETEATRTKICRRLLASNYSRTRSFNAVAAAGVDEQALVNLAAQRIRALGKAEDRAQVARTLAGHQIIDEAGRKSLVGLIGFLLKPDRPKADTEVAAALFPALGLTPLQDPEPLTKFIRRAQKRHGLHFTEAQGRQLVSLGVAAHDDWFGKRVAKRLSNLLSL